MYRRPVFCNNRGFRAPNGFKKINDLSYWTFKEAVVRNYVLSPDERETFFKRQGYLVIPNAVPSDQVDQIVEGIDRQGEKLKRPGFPNVNAAGILGMESAFLDLIDCPKVFPKIWGILGWNIWVHHSHLNINPPQAPQDKYNYGWHRDGGGIRLDCPVVPTPMLSIKVAFYLTDIEPGGGATYMIEGSHENEAAAMPENTLIPANARPLHNISRGTAVIFDSRIVHSRHSPNTSQRTRKAIFLTYGFRWLKGMDKSSVDHLKGKVSPIRHQLLGLTEESFSKGIAGGRSDAYLPREEDVPLKGYIREFLGPDADKYVARSVKTDLPPEGTPSY
jgi:ectoine hydroxylase